MKTLLALVAVGAVIAGPAFAQSAPQGSRQGWSSRVHVYAPDHYAPWYDSYGNANLNPDRQLVR